MKNKISYLAAATLLMYSGIHAVAQNSEKQQEVKNDFLRKQHQLATTIDNLNLAAKKKFVYHLENTANYELRSDGQWYEAGSTTNYQYDSKHNLIHEEDLGRATRDYTYDNRNNLLTRVDKTWDGTSWQESFRWTYTYNRKRNLLLRSVMEQKTSYGWINFEKDEFSYDANGRLIDDVFYLVQNNAFYINSKRTKAYNSANQVESDTYYVYSNGGWAESSRSVFYYNASGNNDLEMMQYYTSSGNWDFS